MFSDMFYRIDATYAGAPLSSLIFVAIYGDNTVVWYGHWEDGYDLDVGVTTAPATEIWGDGNAAIGWAPGVTTCTNSIDELIGVPTADVSASVIARAP